MEKLTPSAQQSKPVYFVVCVHIPDPDNRRDYDEYIRMVKPVVEKAGGRYLARSEKVSTMFGGECPDRVIIIEFESRSRLEACFSSAEYQAIKQLRENSVSSLALIIE